MRSKNEVPGFVETGSEGDSATLHMRVLGYKEDGEWCALCLEMDLRGYGHTFDEAVEDLHNAVVSQFTFAMQVNNPDLLAFRAEQKYHDIFADLLHLSIARKMVANQVVQEAQEESQMIRELPVPSPKDLNRGVYATA